MDNKEGIITRVLPAVNQLKCSLQNERRELLADISSLIVAKRQVAAQERRRFFCPDTMSVDAYNASLIPYRKSLIDTLGWPLSDAFFLDEPAREIPYKGTVQFLSQDEYGSIYSLGARTEIKVGTKRISLRVGGLLFMPKRASRLPCSIINPLVSSQKQGNSFGEIGTEKWPLIIALHGGMGSPELAAGLTEKGSCNYNGMVTGLRRHDVAVFAPQLLVWHNGQEPIFNQFQMDRELRQLGGSRAAVDLLMLRSSLNWLLASISMLDAERIGMVGLSYGGFYTLLFSAIDTRIRAAVSSCFVNDRYHHMHEDMVWTGVARKFLDVEIAHMICPRPLFIEAGAQDPVFEPRHFPKVSAEIAVAYERLGISSHFQSRIHNGGHEYDTDGVATSFILREIGVLE